MSVCGSNMPCLCAGLLLLYLQSISRKKDLCFWSSPPGNSCSPLALTGYFPFSSPQQFKHCSTAHCQKVHYNLGIQKTNKHTYIHTQSTENQKTLGNSSPQHRCMLPVLLLVAFQTSIYNNRKNIHWDLYRLYTTAA